jgi:hypothetical protein
MLMQVNNKRQMYALYEKGEFGNKTRSWIELSDYLADEFPGKVALRYMEYPGGPCIYNLRPHQVVPEFKKWFMMGYKPEFIHISEMIDDSKVRLGGEVMQSENYLDLTYYDTPGYHMRDGLRLFGKEASGLKALALLHRHMDPTSGDNLRRLLADYPDHAIEFTCCEGSVGELGWNTVFWEVRGY